MTKGILIYPDKKVEIFDYDIENVFKLHYNNLAEVIVFDKLRDNIPSMSYNNTFTSDMKYNEIASNIATILKYFMSNGKHINIYGKALILNEYNDEMKDITKDELNDLLNIKIKLINEKYGTKYEEEDYLLI
jgi:hypothetical protein